MGLPDLLRSRRGEILRRWRKAILEVYDPAFAARSGDRFTHPVGAAVRSGSERVLDALIEGRDREDLARGLDEILRMRSVQDLDPEAALAFVFRLRPILRDAAGDDPLAADLDAFEERLETMALTALRIYVGCREEIWELKYRMMRDRSYKLMERAGFLWEEK